MERGERRSDERPASEEPHGGPVEVRRARIEEIRPLAAEYKREQDELFGAPTNAPLPQGGIFWLATDAKATLGYAAGTLRASGCTIGPIFTRAGARRRGVGQALLRAIQQWAGDTRVPVVEISVAADNAAGLAFLESLGYVPRRVLMSLTPDRLGGPPRGGPPREGPPREGPGGSPAAQRT